MAVSSPSLPRQGSLPRARGSGLLLPGVLAAAVGTVLVVYLAVWGRRYGLDLLVYRQSASSFLRGGNPYHLTFTHGLPFTYPPFALAFLSWMTLGSFLTAQWVLWILSLGAATASVFLVLRDRGHPRGLRLWLWAFAWACAATLLFEPARSGMDYGQVEFLLMGLVVADLLFVRSPFRGIALGIAGAVKLTPLVFVVVLVARRDWWSVVRAGLSFLACSAAAWLAWPQLSSTFWGHELTRPGRIGPVASASNQSWYGLIHRAPFDGHHATVVWVLLSGATLVLGAFVAWRCAQTGRQSFAVLAIALAGLLASPISWSHHWVWVILIPPMLVGAGRETVPPVVRTLLWCLVVLTVAGPYWWVSAGWAADLLEALLPVWTAVVLAVWSIEELGRWRTSAPPAVSTRPGG